MENRSLYRVFALLLTVALLLPLLAGCGEGKGESSADGITKLSFREASGYDYLKKLDGSKVSIRGYMATSSPVDGSFMFLMNLPYQSCPFCVPNTSQLSNTMEIYPKEGDAFTYTAQAIEVVGTLEVAEKEDEPFTDSFGYEFNFKVVDGEYTVLQDSDLTGDVALWQRIASTDVVSEVYRMYDYVNFLVAWPTYYVNSFTDENGQEVPGYYLYAADAENFLYNDGAQYNYGYKDGYFDDIIGKIEAVDPNAFSDLVANIRKAQALAEEALAELKNGNYTMEYKYVEMFGKEDYIYTLNRGEELTAKLEPLYTEFSHWLGSWEM
jgi:hypothetical protein